MICVYKCFTSMLSASSNPIELTFRFHESEGNNRVSAAQDIKYTDLIALGNTKLSWSLEKNFEKLMCSILRNSDEVIVNNKLTIDFIEINRFDRTKKYNIQGVNSNGIVVLIDGSDRDCMTRYEAERWMRPEDYNHVNLEMKTKAPCYYVYSERTITDTPTKTYTRIIMIDGGLYKLAFNTAMNYEFLESMRSALCSLADSIWIDSWRKAFCQYWCGSRSTVRFDVPKLLWVDSTLI